MFISFRHCKDRSIQLWRGYKKSKYIHVGRGVGDNLKHPDVYMLHFSPLPPPLPPPPPPSPCRYDALLQEKEELEEGFEAFRQEVVLTRQGNASKELRILKKVIKNLEVCSHMAACWDTTSSMPSIASAIVKRVPPFLQADILKERTKHQRYANKKNEEVRALLQEVSSLLNLVPSLHFTPEWKLGMRL